MFSEVSDNNDPNLIGLKQFLDIFDYCSLFLFMVEIILKWMDDFFSFWKNGWNNFDFFVTVGVRLWTKICSKQGKRRR